MANLASYRRGRPAGGGVVGSETFPDWDQVFFEAALEPERWPIALARMASHTGATHGNLIGMGRARGVLFNITNDIEASHLSKAIDMGGGSPNFNYRAAASQDTFAHGHYDDVLYEKHYDAVMPFLTSRLYVDWCDEIDIPYGCQTNLVVDRVGFVVLATLRKRNEGRTTAKERRVFATAAPAARRAVRLQERLEGDQARLLAGAFDAIRASAFILDSLGMVQAMTIGAERVVGSGAVKLRGRRLEAQGTPFSLTNAADALTAPDGLDHLQMRVDRPADQSPLFLEGFRLPVRNWSLGHLPHAILLVKSPQGDRAGVAAFLGVLYKLSAAEADIAIRLFDGVGRAEIAAHRQVTSETLRGQIKTICAKTGSDNEAALMRVLAAILS